MRARLLVCAVCLLCAVGFRPVQSALLLQGATLDDATHAVVRIRGCNIQGCNQGVGSGAIIDASGLILTAHHVTLSNPQDRLSDQLDDFVIEVTDNARSAPTARYRARAVAQKPAADLALLGVYWDEAAGRNLAGAELNLPYLTLADPESVAFGEELTILGYPLAGGRSINYASEGLSGFDEGGSLLKVQKSLSEGNSGGPALVRREDGYAIAGVVIERRGTLGEVGLIRSVGDLSGLDWTPSARRAVVGAAELTLVAEASGAPVAQIDLRLFDLAGHSVRLLAYAFDGETLAPYRPADPNLRGSVSGQMVLSAELTVQSFAEHFGNRIFQLTAMPADLQVESLVFRLALWDVQDGRLLWSDTQWRRPRTQVAAVVPSATNMPVPVPLPSDTPIARTTLEPTDKPEPAATSTVTPVPTSTPTATATPTPTPPPSDTPTIAPTPTETTQPTATSTATSIPASTPTATPTPTPAAPAAGTVREFGGIRFVYVPPGEFRMGSSDAEVQRAIELCRSYPDDGGGDCATKFEDERPTRPVYLDAFWIMQTEITNAQFASFVNSSGYLEQRYWSEEGWNWRKGEGITQPGYWSDARLNEPQQPAVGLSWFEAEAFTNWFGQQSGLPARLPSEEEWEKAARDADGRFFPWGNDWNGSNANFCDRSCNLYAWADPNVNDGYAFTAPVGMYPAGASPYGALDMAGNVWEWVANRARRGGSWINDPEGLRTTERLYDDRYTRTNTLEFPSKAGTGFRLVISDY